MYMVLFQCKYHVYDIIPVVLFQCKYHVYGNISVLNNIDFNYLMATC